MAKHARILSDAEFDALVAHVERKRNGARNRLVVFLTHYAGMRIGECSSLLHSDLIGRSYEGTANFYHNNIGHKVVQQIQLRKRAVKGKHARSVVLSERVRREIVQYFMSLADLDVKAPLCVGYKGQMSNKTLALQHRDWMCELGLYGAFSHSGRRRFVTNFLERGTNIRTV